jgi:hypothetical protein
MSYLGTMTTEQLGQNGFDISPDNPDLAISRVYPNLSMRHRCQKCGNWSRIINGKCAQCFVGKEPLKPTRQCYKFYLHCCAAEDCPTRREALAFLSSSGMDTRWRSGDGFGEYISLEPIRSWAEAERSEFFATINEFSVSKFGARLLCHPNSNRRSKLPKRPK